MSRKIYLRGIDVRKLAEGFLDGNFKEFDRRTKIEADDDSTNNSPIIAPASNVEVVKMCDSKYISIGGYGYESNCMYCLKRIKTSSGRGIPISCSDGVYKTVDIFCCYECMFAEAKRRSHTTNRIYGNSINLIRCMYFEETGRNDLQPASDHRLLNVFNGPLTTEEFHKCHGKFPSNTNVAIIECGQLLEERQCI